MEPFVTNGTFCHKCNLSPHYYLKFIFNAVYFNKVPPPQKKMLKTFNIRTQETFATFNNHSPHVASVELVGQRCLKVSSRLKSKYQIKLSWYTTAISRFRQSKRKCDVIGLTISILKSIFSVGKEKFRFYDEDFQETNLNKYPRCNFFPIMHYYTKLWEQGS